MAPVKRSAVDQGHLDLIVQNIKDAHSATNSLIEEKLNNIRNDIAQVARRIDATNDDLYNLKSSREADLRALRETDIAELRRQQLGLTKRVYVGVGVFAVLEIALMFAAHAFGK